jgi:site-specific recombinase XerC
MQLQCLAKWWDDPATLTSEAIETFLDTRKGRSGGRLSARTRYVWLSNLGAFYDWAVLDGRVDSSPVAKVCRPRLRPGLPRPISEADLSRVLSATHQTDLAAWLVLMACAGLRCAEVAGIEWSDVLFADKLLRVVGKGLRVRMVPTHPDVETALVACGVRSSGPVFRRCDGAPWTPRAVSMRARRHLDALGVDATPHQLRHRFGTQLYRRTLDLRLVQDLMGHSSPVTTAGYAAWSREHAADAVRSLTVMREVA